jgi:hypothetical protein
MSTLMVAMVDDLAAVHQAMKALHNAQISRPYRLDAAAVYMERDGTLKYLPMNSAGVVELVEVSLDGQMMSSDVTFFAALFDNLMPGRAALLMVAGVNDNENAPLMTVMLLLAHSRLPQIGHTTAQSLQGQEDFFRAKVDAYQKAVANLDLLPATAQASDLDVAYQAVDEAYLGLRHFFSPPLSSSPQTSQHSA